MDEIVKTHKEIIALHKLHPEIDDLYVEGNEDKAFYSNFLRSKGRKRRVVEISTINFHEIPVEYYEGLDHGSSRSKVVVLSKSLAEFCAGSKAACIVDRDFDDFVNHISNNFLLQTDFSCLESYLFSVNVLVKFLESVVRPFPFPAETLIAQMTPILKAVFCLRLFREKFDRSAKLPDLAKNIEVRKTEGTIVFDRASYLEKFVLKNGLAHKREAFLKDYEGLLSKLKSDNRFNLQGHDFLEALYLYVNGIKNTSNFRSNHIAVVVYATAEPGMVESFELFRTILA
jgi:hypothetical protein